MSLTTLLPVTLSLELPEGPRLMVEHHLIALARFKGFEDRINYANELLERLQTLVFAGVIDGRQHAQALRHVRAALHNDLGVVGDCHGHNVFDEAAFYEAQP